MIATKRSISRTCSPKGMQQMQGPPCLRRVYVHTSTSPPSSAIRTACEETERSLPSRDCVYRYPNIAE
jgi:hypothetical protein